MKVSWLVLPILAVTLVSALEVPEEISVCSRNDPQLEECLKKSIQFTLERIKDGIPSLDVQPLDPFSIQDIDLKYSGLASLLGNLNIEKLSSHGLINGTVKQVRVNLTEETMDMEIDVNFPKVFVEGFYKGTGRIGLVWLNSKGPFNVSIFNADVTWKLSGKMENIENENYMKILSFKMFPEMEDFKLNMEGLFPSARVTKATVSVLNNGWKVFYKLLLPETQEFWSPLISDIANKLFLKFPFNVLMPE